MSSLQGQEFKLKRSAFNMVIKFTYNQELTFLRSSTHTRDLSQKIGQRNSSLSNQLSFGLGGTFGKN